jgi:hypothetical protein
MRLGVQVRPVSFKAVQKKVIKYKKKEKLWHVCQAESQ